MVPFKNTYKEVYTIDHTKGYPYKRIKWAYRWLFGGMGNTDTEGP